MNEIEVAATAETRFPAGSWQVYMVRCADDSLYTGVSSHLQRRFREHNRGSRGARYTRTRRPVTLVYCEAADNRASAQQREAAIRRLSRAAKRTLAAAWIRLHKLDSSM
ncbi:MAG: endonuclease [Gammaproteobacteria bacterium]|nr:MAG: endonuclease [Gammaproteobacteria bacterium]